MAERDSLTFGNEESSARKVSITMIHSPILLAIHSIATILTESVYILKLRPQMSLDAMSDFILVIDLHVTDSMFMEHGRFFRSRDR